MDPAAQPQHSLVALVSPTAFHDLPSPLPIDLLASKHVTNNAFKHSLILQDLADQPDPIGFCLSLGAFHLLESYTRTHLPTLAPTLADAPTIMRLWTHRLAALVALDVAHIALAESRALDLVHHPLAPLHLQLAAARLPALANDPLRALDLLAKIATRHEHDKDESSPSSSSSSSCNPATLAVLAAYRHMIAVAAWHLSDPRLVSHLIAQTHAKLGRGRPIDQETVPDASARVHWWFQVVLARMAVTQLTHADHALGRLEREAGGSGAALVQYARAALLSCRGQGAEAAAAWTSLWNQVVGTARRIRVYEAAHASVVPAAVAAHLPPDFAALPGASPSAAVGSPATYAADCAWLAPVLSLRLLSAIANNRLVAQVYRATPSPAGGSPGEASGDTANEALQVDWMQAAKWGAFADAPLVGNLATWIEVTPNGSVAGEALSVMDRKREVMKAMGKVTDAACVAALRMG